MAERLPRGGVGQGVAAPVGPRPGLAARKHRAPGGAKAAGGRHGLIRPPLLTGTTACREEQEMARMHAWRVSDALPACINGAVVARTINYSGAPCSSDVWAVSLVM